MPFDFVKLSIPEVILIKPRVFPDFRGFFMETYKYSDFAMAGIKEHFVQDNFSKSAYSVLRGLHFQKTPKAQGKLVQCFIGKIFDVVVDIRKGSPTYAKWIGGELSETEGSMLYIPPGFAHGFVVLSNVAEVIYKCTDEYSPEHEKGIIWNDPTIRINWSVKEPILSDKDKQLPYLTEADNNYCY